MEELKGSVNEKHLHADVVYIDLWSAESSSKTEVLLIASKQVYR